MFMCENRENMYSILEKKRHILQNAMVTLYLKLKEKVEMIIIRERYKGD